jgi:8-oxo-dGTP diphosphatase
VPAVEATRSYDRRVVLVVAAIVVDSLREPRRLLAARRVVGDVPGRWELPGGKVEVGEAPITALRRELAEELGVAVEVGVELISPSGSAWPINDRYAMRTWFAEITAGVPMPTGSHDQLRWLTPEELVDVDWLAPDRPIVETVRSCLIEGGSARS